MASLESVLRECLPKDEQFELLNLQNIPMETKPLVTSLSSHNDSDRNSKTIKVPHFFALAHNKKFVYGIEIHVYLILSSTNGAGTYDKVERLLFVSKADTNGYCDVKFSAKQVTKGLIHYLMTLDPVTYLRHVIPLERKYTLHDKKTLLTRSTSLTDALEILSQRTKLTHKPESSALQSDRYFLSFSPTGPVTTKLCIFTRPADQYLFADSAKNPRKHTLSGAGLLKWWVSIVDEVICEDFTPDSDARLRIPGEDDLTVRRFLRGTKFAKWTPGDIFGGEANSLAVFSIPLFSDDPKSRFLHELVEENRIMKTNLNQFWIELQERQEFKLSETVSVIGISGLNSKAPSGIPLPKEVVRTDSKKYFKYVKNYITGEEYDTSEGAEESYRNTVQYLSLKYSSELLQISGQRTSHSGVKENAPVVRAVTMLQPRKKVKTTK